MSDHYKKDGLAEAAQGVVTVGDAIAYATAEGQSVGAVFLKMTRKDDKDSLIGVKADVGTSAQMHRTEVDDNGVAQLREVSGFKLSPGKICVLNPAGYHIMILVLTKP